MKCIWNIYIVFKKFYSNISSTLKLEKIKKKALKKALKNLSYKKKYAVPESIRFPISLYFLLYLGEIWKTPEVW